MKVKNLILGLVIGIGGVNLSYAKDISINNIMQNTCYTKRRLPINYKLAFDAMKDTFLKSNISLVNLSREDGFIYGKGILKRGDNVYSLNISANFTQLGDLVQINVKASYSLMKQEYATDTGGIAGINFPMPVLWKKEFNLKDSGNIKDPNFYMGFFRNYNKVLFDDMMMNDKIILDTKPNKINVEINTTKDLNQTIKLNNEVNTTKDLNQTIKLNNEVNTTKESNQTIKLNNEINTTKESNQTIKLNNEVNTTKVVKVNKEINTTKVIKTKDINKTKKGK